MPQRLVYVGTNTSQYCYLVYSKNTDLEAESYATLSYCWGKGPHSHSLTKSNMKEYEKCISDIPATLRDAISLVRDMGLHYIWIDVLCIVQDDEEDWKIEAGKMAEIYASALFCISALCTTGSDSGLFGNTHRIPSTKKSWEFVSSFESFPLNSRGWTLQERYLSPRLLHIGLSEAWFECRESLVSLTESTGLKCSTRIGATGTFIGLDRFSRLLNDTCLGQLNSAESPIFSSWYDMVMNYCPRQLSKETDRLIALDGLRSLYQPFTNCKYIYGLWEHDIYNGLLWFNGINGHGNISSCSFDPPSMIVFKMNSRCGESSSGMGFGRDPVYLRRSRISSGIISRTLNKSQKIDTDTSFTLDNIRDRTGNVPTWSWASLCGPISFCYINGEDFFIFRGIEIPKLRIQVYLLTQRRLFGTLKPCLSVRGTIFKVEIEQSLWVSQIEYGIEQQQGRSGAFRGRSNVFFDKDEQENYIDCHALVVYQLGPSEIDSGLFHLTLILLKRNGKDPFSHHCDVVYERIGLAFMEYDDVNFFAYLNTQDGARKELYIA